jgi:hypothetical protein
MDRKAALATAAGLVLVVAGAASALTSTWIAPAQATTTSSATVTPTVITEYVDAAGNPVAPPSQVQPENIILTRSPADEEVIVSADPITVFADTPAAPTISSVTTAAATSGGYDDDDEHEDEDEHETESDHG